MSGATRRGVARRVAERAELARGGHDWHSGQGTYIMRVFN